MTDLTKRPLLKLGGFAPWRRLRPWRAAARRKSRRRRSRAAPAPAAAAAAPHQRRPLKIAFAYVGPVGDAGWTFAHDNGRKAVEKRVRRQGRHQLRRERARGRRRRARAARHGRPGQQADLRHHVRLHGADAEGRRRRQGREVRARHRLQDAPTTCAPTTRAPTKARTWPAWSRADDQDQHAGRGRLDPDPRGHPQHRLASRWARRASTRRSRPRWCGSTSGSIRPRKPRARSR